MTHADKVTVLWLTYDYNCGNWSLCKYLRQDGAKPLSPSSRQILINAIQFATAFPVSFILGLAHLESVYVFRGKYRTLHKSVNFGFLNKKPWV